MKKYKLKNIPAEPDDEVYLDQSIRVVGIPKRKRKYLIDIQPAPEDHEVYLDKSARVRPIPPKFF